MSEEDKFGEPLIRRCLKSLALRNLLNRKTAPFLSPEELVLKDYAEFDVRLSDEGHRQLAAVPKPIDPEHVCHYVTRTLRWLMRLCKKTGIELDLNQIGPNTFTATRDEGTKLNGALIEIGDGNITVNTMPVPSGKRTKPAVFLWAMNKGFEEQ